ncbi:MAG: methyltransferase domain-containing protein [Cyclobacteriaceae bacterium]
MRINMLLFGQLYPKELYDFIFSQLRSFNTAWDVGTGNGQVARDLSSKFKKIFATDISAKQIENAPKAENIFYSVAAETSELGHNT